MLPSAVLFISFDFRARWDAYAGPLPGMQLSCLITCCHKVVDNTMRDIVGITWRFLLTFYIRLNLLLTATAQHQSAP